MEHNTTIPSILSLTDEPDASAKHSGASPIIKFALWGLLAALAVLLFRFVKR